MGIFVQYGCGLSAPGNWLNYDASPTLRLQKLPLIGRFINKVHFPASVKYGDISKTLPGINENSCDAIFCSHVLEHLSFNDLNIALRNTYRYLKPGGYFRCVLPDLEYHINAYQQEKLVAPASAAIHFMRSTMLGTERKEAGLVEKLSARFGNHKHLWMWDRDSLYAILRNTGFTKIRACEFGDSAVPAFKDVELEDRFWAAIAFECIK